MIAIVNVILPVFAIIGLGYLAVRFRLYPAEGVSGLVAFVNNFATPFLLLRAMLTSDFGHAFNLGIILPFYAGAFSALAIGIITARRIFGNRPGESVASGFSASFANTVLVGLPIISRAYGDPALPVIFSIMAFHASVLITVAMLVMELMRRDGAPIGRALWSAGGRIVRNPLLWGIVVGLVGNYFHVTLIEPVDDFFSTMAAAVVPAALFGLGGALNEYRLADNWPLALVMSLIKLILQPLIAWVLMVPVLGVDPSIARYGVLLAAMPSGINVYVFATYYNRGVNVATNVVLISTVMSLVTVSAWLLLLG
jgi:predicted permease